jgi:hypothetical protein
MFRRFVTILALALGLGLLATARAASPDAPTSLLVNGVANPQAVDKTAPLFTWMMNAANLGAFQLVYP